MDGKALARLAAIVIVAVAGTAAAIYVARDTTPSVFSTATPDASETPTTDPLRAALHHCVGLGEAAASDPDCLAAWAENRRRFLGADEAH